MNTLTLVCQGLYSQAIATNIFMEGGPVFMSLILICLLASFAFLIRGFANVKKSGAIGHKSLKLAEDMSLLGLVMGFLGSVLGLISAFDSVEAMGNPPPEMFAGGLKVSLLTATFGLFTFIVVRIGIVILRFRLPSEEVSE